MDKKDVKRNEPTVAPSMNTHDSLEKKATKKEIQQGDFTEVTRLYIDRTPED
ncbi:hypothetical protein ACFSCZ_08145 [Siminovitchia sediminis]|uniref:Uncharacterized protein n=1 Tax=Siminovitchia sediminis TaxID=1274353 RepID=A0ABW4KFP2_9BACI